MTDSNQAAMRKYRDAITFAQELPRSPVYALKSLPEQTGISAKTIRRRVRKLEELGLARYHRGRFSVKREVVSQPQTVLGKLYPSLVSLKNARRFGKFYRKTDINFVKKHLPENSFVTLDHRAHELTQFQTPKDFYVYVDDVSGFGLFLKRNGFKEGRRGNIVLLPKTGSFGNEKERIFLDCIAQGGRSFNDAVAMGLIYKDVIETRARFAMDTILKVAEDMQSPVYARHGLEAHAT